MDKLSVDHLLGIKSLNKLSIKNLALGLSSCLATCVLCQLFRLA